MQFRGAVLEKLLEYLSFKNLYEAAGRKEDIPDFQERIQPEIALELSVYHSLFTEPRLIPLQKTDGSRLL